MKIFIPQDAGAAAVGADAVAASLSRELASRGAKSQIVRTGSRAMFDL